MKTFRRLFAAALAIAAAASTWFFLLSLDGCVGSIWSRFGPPHETVYSSGYSSWAFRRVRTGDAEERVLSVLGPPIAVVKETSIAQFTRIFPAAATPVVVTNGDSITRWTYSTTTNDDSYAIRQIEFIDGKVVHKTSGYYVD